MRGVSFFSETAGLLGQTITLLGLTYVGFSASADDAKPISLSRLSPPGGQAGTTVAVKATGEFPNWPVAVWTDRGQLTWEPQEDSGAFAVTIPAEGAFGLHRIRFTDRLGATAVKPFLVGNIPEAAENEPNDSRSEATAIQSMPVTINGVLEKSGDVDGYRVHLEAGETLVASLVAHERLGSPIDAVLELVDAGGAYQARNLDAVSLDPRLVHTATRDGHSIVRVYAFPSDPNSTIGLSGSAESLYRLTLTTGSFLTGTLPTAATFSDETELHAAGVNLPEGASPLPVAFARATSTWVQFPGVAGVIKVPAVEASLALAAQETQTANPLAPPMVGSGWFTQADQVDRFLLNVPQDQKLLVRIESQKTGFEADPLLTIRDASGKSLMAKQERDASFTWTAPADGTYTFEVRDRRGCFGPGFLYRLTVEPEMPRFAVSVAADQFTATAGEPLTIEVAVDRQFGFAETVECVLDSAPNGVTAEFATSPNEGDAAKAVSLTLTATAPASGPLRLIARPAGSTASTPVVFGGQQLPEAWLTVLPAAEDGPASQDSQ